MTTRTLRTLLTLASLALVFGCSKADQASAPEHEPTAPLAAPADGTAKNGPPHALLPAEGTRPTGQAGHNAPDTPAGPIGHKVAEIFQVGPTTYVRSLFVQGDDLYVGTSTGVVTVNRHTGESTRTFSARDGMRDPYAFVVRPGPNNSVWMGTNSGGLAVYSAGKDGHDGSLKSYLPKHGLADIWVYDIAWAADGTTWLGTWDGANRISGDMDDKKSWTTFKVADGLANPWVYAIQIDSQGAVWFGTEGGLSRFVDDTWTTWRHADGLGAANPKQLAASPKSGFGSNRSGQHSHDLTTLDATGNETYNENYVFSLLLDDQEALWIGTWGGGVSRFDGKTFHNLTQKDGLAGNVVYAIAQGADGAMWFGTNHGISRYDGEVWTTFGRAEGLVGDDVYTLAIDADHTIWAGQRGAVIKLQALMPQHGY